MGAILKLVSIGNSRGVRLPKALLQRYRFDKEIRAIETAEGLLLQAVETDKLSWEETFSASAKEIQAENAAWEGILSEGLEPDQFKGWPR